MARRRERTGIRPDVDTHRREETPATARTRPVNGPRQVRVDAAIGDREDIFGARQRQSAKVAVGTRIAPRPPHRSRRALLTHRAYMRTRLSRGISVVFSDIDSSWLRI